jgi:hypothetical protein
MDPFLEDFKASIAKQCGTEASPPKVALVEKERPLGAHYCIETSVC